MSRFDVADLLVALCEAGEVELAVRIARAMHVEEEIKEPSAPEKK